MDQSSHISFCHYYSCFCVYKHISGAGNSRSWGELLSHLVNSYLFDVFRRVSYFLVLLKLPFILNKSQKRVWYDESIVELLFKFSPILIDCFQSEVSIERTSVCASDDSNLGVRTSFRVFEIELFNEGASGFWVLHCEIQGCRPSHGACSNHHKIVGLGHILL